MWKNIIQRTSFKKTVPRTYYPSRFFKNKPNSNCKSIHKNFAKCFVFGTGFKFLNNLSADDEDDHPFADGRLTEDMQNACHKSVEALVELMRTLNVCLMEINKEYNDTMQKQIVLTKQCTELGPLGEHWDELTKYRVQADDLKMEFSKYELLVQKVGQMVFYQAVTSLMSGNEKEMDLLNYEYNRLEKLVQDLTEQNRGIETKLLTQNRESILGTPTPKFSKN